MKPDLKLTSEDLKKLEEFKKKNFEDRLKFIDFAVEWMKKHPTTWSKAQKGLINGQYGESD